MNTDKFLKGNISRDTIIPHPVCYNCNRFVICVCLYFRWYPLSEVGPRQWFSIFWWLINKEKKNEKECVHAWNGLNIQLQTLWFASSAAAIKKRYKIPPRNENTRNEKTPQRQTTTSTTSTISTTVRIIKQLQLQQSFCLILFYSSVR